MKELTIKEIRAAYEKKGATLICKRTGDYVVQWNGISRLREVFASKAALIRELAGMV